MDACMGLLLDRRVRGSDVDSCLVLPGVTQKAEQLTKLRVVKALLERYSVGAAEVIPAQVPIAKVSSIAAKTYSSSSSSYSSSSSSSYSSSSYSSSSSSSSN
ncbi:hypothetical protein ACSSS7_005561 [Eimeria intestinalis]